MNDSRVAAGAAPSTADHRAYQCGLVATGFVATLAATVATTVAAALAEVMGVDFEILDGGETIPLPGFAVVTGISSLAGVGIALGLLQWSARPVKLFVWSAVSLSAISLIAPWLSGGNAATVTALVGLHLVAAAVVIPTLARGLRNGAGGTVAPTPRRPTTVVTSAQHRSGGGAGDVVAAHPDRNV